jgi:predicted DNA-binding transcriptional regulator AlpA
VLLNASDSIRRVLAIYIASEAYMAADVLTQPPRRLLTPQETSLMLGVTVETLAVWRSTKRYDLPWVKIGRLVRYTEADVHSFIELRTVR